MFTWDTSGVGAGRCSFVIPLIYLHHVDNYLTQSGRYGGDSVSGGGCYFWSQIGCVFVLA